MWLTPKLIPEYTPNSNFSVNHGDSDQSEQSEQKWTMEKRYAVFIISFGHISHLVIYLFIYLFSDSWIKGYVPKTKIQGAITTQFPIKFQVPTCSVLWTRWCKLSCNLVEIV